jgi:hypothetical protein
MIYAISTSAKNFEELKTRITSDRNFFVENP